MPMWQQGDRLMDKFETAFGLADRLDWISPDAGGPIEMQADVDAEPLIDQTEFGRVVQVKLVAKLAMAVAVGITEEAIVGASR